jgi:hypothetical protein
VVRGGAQQRLDKGVQEMKEPLILKHVGKFMIVGIVAGTIFWGALAQWKIYSIM